MPIAASDLKYYASASMPENDTGTSGGAIDTAVVVANMVQASNTAPKLKSTNAGDTMNVTVTGRDAAGAIISEVKALTGTTVTAAFTATFERILKVVIASAPAGVVSLLMNDGTTVIVDIPAGKTAARRFFYDAASSPGGAKNRYEKLYGKNEHGSLTLNAAKFRLTADPSEDANHDIQIGVESSGNQSVTNRETAPGSVTFVDENTDIDITSLAAAGTKGLWVRQTLATSASANKSTFTVELAGTTA